MLVFRSAQAKDINEIMRVIHEAQVFMYTLGIDQWQDGYPEERILMADIDLNQLYVFSEDGLVHAVAALSLEQEPVYKEIDESWKGKGAYLTIHRMATDDSARGRGLARQMLEKAEHLAYENGCGSVRVDTHRGNVAMRRFLEKNGFEYRGIVHYYVKKGDPVRVAYEKLI